MKKVVLFLILIVSSTLLSAQESLKKDEQYIQAYARYAVEEMELYKIPASITLAQGILETGNGQSDLAQFANNHFGIKCKEEWTGERMYHDDDAKGECFRKYSSAEESYRDHSLFLANRPYYKKLFYLDSKDYKAWAWGLKQAGYATNPKYAYNLINLIEKYHLHQFDQISIQQVDTKLAEMFPNSHPNPLSDKLQSQEKWVYSDNNTHKKKSEVYATYKEKVKQEIPSKPDKILVVETDDFDKVESQEKWVYSDNNKQKEQKQSAVYTTYKEEAKQDSPSKSDKILAIETNDFDKAEPKQKWVYSDSNKQTKQKQSAVYATYKEEAKQETPSKSNKTVAAEPDNIEFASMRIKFHPNGNLKFIVIKEGDKLEDISKTYNISVKNLKIYNDLIFRKNLKVNQKIFLEPKKKSGIIKEYIVKEGDRMYDVAQNNGISLIELYKKNLMHPGQEPKIGKKIILRGKRS